MFGQPTGFAGFGQSQPQQSPFGAAPASPFGAAPTGFGQPQQAAPFGGATGGLFGASQPAFGASSAPAFGASTAPAFGSSAFGAPRPATGFGGFGAPASPFGASQPAFGNATTSTFGQPSQPAFGITTAPSFGIGQSAPAFGASSSPAFGAMSAPAFGAASPSPFGTSTFGAPATPAFGASAPAFGAASAPAFGAPGAAPSPFGGTSVFGAASSPFGTSQPAGGMFGTPAAGGFGMQQQAVAGSRAVAYQKTMEKDGTSQPGGTGTAMGTFISISAMPAYQGKSFEELRWEDYQQNVKSAAAGPVSPGGLGAPSPFGAAPASPFGIGPASAPAFGQSQSAFGTTAASSFFGASSASPFGTSTAPAFGAGAASPFGTPTSSTFGPPATTSAFGAFGSAPAFGAQNPGSVFGASSAPAFGTGSSLFTTSTPAFAAAPTASAFNFSSSPSIFGGASSQPAASPSPFGSSPSLFGPSPSPFGPSSAAASPFGSAPAFAASSSPFGTTSAFGTKPATPGPFGTPGGLFNASSAAAGTSSFGTIGGSFNFGGQTQSSLFGTMSAPAFSSSPGLGSTFGAPFGSTLGAPGAPGMSLMPVSAVPQGPPASVSQAPYGSFPSLPAVPEPKVGISARPARSISVSSYKGSPLLSIRSAGTTPRFGVQVRSSSVSPIGLLAGPTSSATEAPAAAPSPSALLPARANPHRLFIREPPPSTEAATSSPTLTPARGAASRRAAEVYEADGDVTPDRRYANGHNAAATSGPSHQNGGHAAAHHSPGEEHLPRLGRLASDGYSYEPSATQLEAMYNSDPSSLKQVMNFTVARRDVGQVRWLVPVDVSSLALDRIVNIQEGEVYCYAEGAKPPVGQGLNTDAEITLYNVYKVDKATGQPVRDGPRVLKWEKALRTMCAKMGAKFVSYKPDGGVWKFEVEHFSRYGLLQDDSDDEEEEEEGGNDEVADMEAETQQPRDRAAAPALRYGVPGPAASAAPGGRDLAATSLDFGSEEREEVTNAAAVLEAVSQGTSDARAHTASGAVLVDMEEEGSQGGEVATDFPALPPPPLQHMLPMQLNLDPSGLLAMRDSFFPASSMRAPADEPAALAPRFTPQPGQREKPAAARHAWVRSPSPLTSTPRGLRASLPQQSATPSVGPLGLPALPSTPAPPASEATSGAALLSDVRSSAAYVDAGLCMGRSFRPGWGPNGMLAIPGAYAGGSHQVHLRRVQVQSASQQTQSEAEGAAALRGLRERLRAALEVHLRHSRPDMPELDLDAPAAAGSWSTEGGAGGSGGVPRWRMQCDRRRLGEVVGQYMCVLQTEMGMMAPGAGGGAERQAAGGPGEGGECDPLLLHCLGHEVETWRLVQVLFEYIEGEEGGERGAGGEAEDGRADALMLTAAGDDPNNDAADALETGSAIALSQSALVAAKRRAGLSRWLRRHAKRSVEAELQAVRDPAEAVLRLLAAHQLAAAAAVAAAAGDVRLATLVAQASGRQTVQPDVAEQLEVWQQAGMSQSLQPDRLLAYKLLAGQVEEVQQRLRLDWRRYLGLLLWYCSSPTAPVSEAVQQYRQALLTDRHTTPPPAPSYIEGGGPQLRGGRAASLVQVSPTATDLHYELLQVWAEQQQQQEGWQPSSLAALLQAAAYSPNPLDASLAWHLLTVMSAVRALPDLEELAHHAEQGALAASDLDALTLDVLSAQMNMIAQLQLAGDLCEWAVYVALHVPEVPSWPGLRGMLVRELLVTHCPEWSASETKRAFLLRKLQLPQELLAAAEAIWAAYKRDALAQCRAQLAAGQWQAAHTLLATTVAPRLFLAGRHEELVVLVEQLLPYAGSLVDWEVGGGLYASYLQLVAAEQQGAAQGPAAAEVLPAQCELLARRVQAAQAALAGSGVEAGAAAGLDESRQGRLYRQLVLSHMAQKVQRVMLVQAAAQGSMLGSQAVLMQTMMTLSCLPSELRLQNLALGSREAAASVAL